MTCPQCAKYRELLERDWRPAVEAVVRKIQEIEFKAGRDLDVSFRENNLPNLSPRLETVTLPREKFKQFRDDYSLMAAWLAVHFKDDRVSPLHLLAPLRRALSTVAEKCVECGGEGVVARKWKDGSHYNDPCPSCAGAEGGGAVSDHETKDHFICHPGDAREKHTDQDSFDGFACEECDYAAPSLCSPGDGGKR